MARTAIPIASVASFLQGEGITSTFGDFVNNMEISLARSPRVHLVVRNGSLGGADFDLVLSAGESSFEQTHTISVSLAGGGQIRVFPLDIPSNLAQPGNVLHIDSADSDFGNIEIWAFTWDPTRRC